MILRKLIHKYGEKSTWISFSYHVEKLTQKYVKILKIKGKQRKLNEENRGEYLHILRMEKDFLSQIPSAKQLDLKKSFSVIQKVS